MGDDDIAAVCWLCGRSIESRTPAPDAPSSTDLSPADRGGVPQAFAIPVHRECLEDGRNCYAAGSPLADPQDVIYLSPTLFRT